MVRLLLFSIFWGQLNKYWLIDWLIDSVLFVYFNKPTRRAWHSCLRTPRSSPLGTFREEKRRHSSWNVPQRRRARRNDCFSQGTNTEVLLWNHLVVFPYNYFIFLLTYILLLILSIRTHSLGQPRCTHLPRVYSWQMWEWFSVYQPSLHFALPVAISRLQWPWMEEFEWERQQEAWKNVLWRDSWEMSI